MNTRLTPCKNTTGSRATSENKMRGKARTACRWSCCGPPRRSQSKHCRCRACMRLLSRNLVQRECTFMLMQSQPICGGNRECCNHGERSPEFKGIAGQTRHSSNSLADLIGNMSLFRRIAAAAQLSVFRALKAHGAHLTIFVWMRATMPRALDVNNSLLTVCPLFPGPLADASDGP
jgi:hypothetical protein